MASSKHANDKQIDLVVLGSGPAGQKAAIYAAKLGKKVLVVERDGLGGSCLHTGTIPSKTLREAALEGGSLGNYTFAAVMRRKNEVIEQEKLVIESQLHRNQVEWVQGTGRFESPHEISIERSDGSERRVKFQYALIATGTSPVRPAEIPFDPTCIYDSDSILEMQDRPTTMLVMGAGVIGCEYASIFAQMGIRVTLHDSRPQFMAWMDPEITTALRSRFEAAKITMKLGVAMESIQKVAEGRVQVRFANGESGEFGGVLCCQGRGGNTPKLNLKAAGLDTTERGHIVVNPNFQTKVPHVYAAGDVIGSPGLAAASAEQGRLAAGHMFAGLDIRFPASFPFGIYTIPEISSMGAQESDLMMRKVPYVVGRAKYNELARGKILGDEWGFIKMLFHRDTRALLGVHVIGHGATELVHIGQAAFILGAGIDFFLYNVFNYPTLAEAYKVAAIHAHNQLTSRSGRVEI